VPCRQVYHDSVANAIPAKHSLVLCMMCCPVGLLAHAATRAWVLRCRPAEEQAAAAAL
jgi:hypothetical protein